jgi:hypothetical protein
MMMMMMMMVPHDQIKSCAGAVLLTASLADVKM